MAKSRRGESKSVGAKLLGLLNPVHDPSLLVAAILTVIMEGGGNAPPYQWALVGLLNWVAVKAVIWLLVNFAFSFVYLVRKGWWVLRHPRLAWRLLDAMGTEEIIIGGLHPDMFVTEDGELHAGQLGYPAMGAPGYYQGMLGASGAPYANQQGAYPDYQGNGYAPGLQSAEMQEFLATHSRLVADWLNYTLNKWRAVSDSQLGWKPLKGRWNSWGEIFSDAFAADSVAQNADQRRFNNAAAKGSAASAVACFLHDLDMLDQMMTLEDGASGAGGQRAGGAVPSQHTTQHTTKSQIIINPRIVDAD